MTVDLPDGRTGHANVIACVDSGAERSYLPLRIAARLGIQSLLTSNPEPSAGLGSTFETWVPPRPIKARIVAEFPEPQGRTLIGPELRLTPWFGEPEEFLLGRADFFQAFQITFDENPVAPLFHLDW